MKKNKRYTILAAIMAVIMLLPLGVHPTVYAQEGVLDSFYVYDEEGRLKLIEITEKDLEQSRKEEGMYSFMPMDLEPGEESTEERSEEGTTEADPSEPPVEEPAFTVGDMTVGIVRFKRDSTTFYYKDLESGKTGYMSPYTAADAAYIRTEEDGIVCKIAGALIKVSYDDVEAIESYKDNTISRYYILDGYLVHRAGYYSGGSLKTSATLVGYEQDYMKPDQNYYSYDGHYFYNSFEKMISDYRSGTYENAVNEDKPYYNYYQYLSFHTKSVFTAEDVNECIVKGTRWIKDSVMTGTGADFISVQDKYSINAHLMLGIAVNESGWGSSTLAKEKNNLFGLKADDDNPLEKGNAFSSVSACIEDFAYGWIHTGYLSGLDSRYYGPHLGDKRSGINVKYASDPYWGEKAAAWGYNYDDAGEDYGRYTIGIATSGKINLYKEPDVTSKVLYTSEPGIGGKLYDYPMIILDQVTSDRGEEFYKILSDMSLLEDRSGRDIKAEFDFFRDYVYAKKKDVRIVFEGSGKNVIPEIPDVPDVPKHILGDVDESGTVDMFDAVCVLDYYVGNQDGSDIILEAADVDGDGSIDMFDAVMILDYYVGNIEEFVKSEIE